MMSASNNVFYSVPSPVSAPSPDRPRIRQRIPKSCLPCVNGKRACDRAKPHCTRCTKKQHECVYANVPLKKPRLARAQIPRPSSSSAKTVNGSSKIPKEDFAVQSFEIQNEVEISPDTTSVSHSVLDNDAHQAGQALVTLQSGIPHDNHCNVDKGIRAFEDTSSSAESKHRISSLRSVLTKDDEKYSEATLNSPSNTYLSSNLNTSLSSIGRSDHIMNGAAINSSYQNRNGQTIWYGENATSSSVFNQVSLLL